MDKKIVYEDGILQKFEDPKGEYNIIYRLTRSPKLSLFEKCTNLKKIADKHFDIYERAVTYDGEEFQTKTEPLKGRHIPQRIEKIGLNIVNHVSNITLEKIKIIRLILNFKIDRKDRIIFLWCSSLRIQNNSNIIHPRLNINMSDKGRMKHNYFRKQNMKQNVKEIDNEIIKLRPPDYVNLFKYSVSGKPILPQKESFCLNCGQKIENYRLYEISFKNIIEGHDNRKRDKQYYDIYNKINMTSSGIEVVPYNSPKNSSNEIVDKLKENKLKNFIIPKIIQELYPKLKYNDYFNLKNDSFFRNKTTYVCDDCYLEITKYCSMAGSNNENLLKTFKKDDINPIFDIFKSIRPKSVAKKTKTPFLTEINKNKMEKIDTDFFQNNQNLYIKEENPNDNISTGVKKRKTMANIMINYDITHSNLNNSKNQNNDANKLNMNNNRKIPKLSLDINETLSNKNNYRKPKRNKTTINTNTNFLFIRRRETNEDNENNEEEEEKDIENIVENKNYKTSLTNNNVKNFFSKNDFKYFN